MGSQDQESLSPRDSLLIGATKEPVLVCPLTAAIMLMQMQQEESAKHHSNRQNPSKQLSSWTNATAN